MNRICKKLALVAAFVIATSSVAQSVHASLIISEVAPWSSGNSPLGADWFEVTNTGSSAMDITGWKMDDSSHSFTKAVNLNGISSIAAGESVIFIESSSPSSAVSAFEALWFGSTVPAGLQIGTYSGSGVGLSTSGDEVNLYNAAGALQASVAFGESPSGPSFSTFNNTAGLDNATITQLSAIGVNGAVAANGDANEIGSPGNAVAPVPVPAAVWLLGSSLLGLIGLRRRA